MGSGDCCLGRGNVTFWGLGVGVEGSKGQAEINFIYLLYIIKWTVRTSLAKILAMKLKQNEQKNGLIVLKSSLKWDHRWKNDSLKTESDKREIHVNNVDEGMVGGELTMGGVKEMDQEDPGQMEEDRGSEKASWAYRAGHGPVLAQTLCGAGPS